MICSAEFLLNPSVSQDKVLPVPLLRGRGQDLTFTLKSLETEGAFSQLGNLDIAIRLCSGPSTGMCSYDSSMVLLFGDPTLITL